MSLRLENPRDADAARRAARHGGAGCTMWHRWPRRRLGLRGCCRATAGCRHSASLQASDHLLRVEERVPMPGGCRASSATKLPCLHHPGVLRGLDVLKACRVADLSIAEVAVAAPRFGTHLACRRSSTAQSLGAGPWANDALPTLPEAPTLATWPLAASTCPPTASTLSARSPTGARPHRRQ